MAIKRLDSAPVDEAPSGTRRTPRPVRPETRTEWLDPRRYELVRRLGAGGMGVVYEVFDRERSQTVALKRLPLFEPAALYRFKQEFRTLADVRHPNLVRLYELVVTEGVGAFFTMELVRGSDFQAYVQKPNSRHEEPEPSKTAIVTQVRREHALVAKGEPSAPVPAPLRPSPADFDRLRPALRQLVEGVMALHAAGKLHRDLKPSNVLVTEDGRVVILDFGVATELPRVVDENLSEEKEIVGTIRYMAPEQALSETPTTATDWYSVGAVLYEALVGRAPFTGSAVDVLAMKTLEDPVPPAQCVEGVPPELDSLCRALLDRDASRRPTGAEILRCLQPATSDPRLASQFPGIAAPAATMLVGRERQLAALREGFEKVLAGGSVTVRVTGASGMGKSAMAAHFLDGLLEGGLAVVLRGRAYERESVPYKAFDTVIDALSRYLVHLEDRGDAIALPADVGALARVFPVLRRVASIHDVADPQDADHRLVRRRAFSALRELLGTLARRRALVVYIDDVHWGDADSAALLLQLVRPPQAPPLLFVLTHREEEASASSFLREMRDHWPQGAAQRDISVGPLDDDEARRLALTLLQSAHPGAEKRAHEVARESRGNPFLIEELARSQAIVSDEHEDGNGAVLSLGHLVAQRLDRLSDPARLLLEVVAVSGRPLPLSVVAQASGTDDAVEKALLEAGARRFLRTGLRDGREVIETTHDRFRETIVARLSKQVLREHHGRLAGALEATPGADPEAVAFHLLGAGQTERAAGFARQAAEQAAKLLAFDQASRLFRLAIDTLPRSTAPGELYARLGEALSWAGRNEEAARAYINAAEKASGAARAGLERAASAQLIAAGRIDEGGMLLRRVLEGKGVRLPRSPLGTIVSFLAYKTRLRLGMQFTERPPADIPAADRERIDALHVAALGLASVDAMLANCMQARQLFEALRAGDRARVVRAATMYYGSHLAQRGGAVDAHEREVRSLIERLVEKGGSAEEAAFSRGMHGVGLVLRGRWREAVHVIDAAFANVSTQQASMQPQIMLYGVYAHAFLGDLIELRQRQERLLAIAEDRGDLFMSVLLTVSHPVVLRLAADDPDGARTQVRDAKARWSHSKYLVQDWQVMRSEADVELYAGHGATAYTRLEQDARALKKSLLLRVQFIRALTAFARGRAAIATIESAPAQRAARLAEARRIARELEGERMTWTAPLAAMVAGAAANAQGARALATDSLRMAIERAQAADMSLYAAAARYQLGRLLRDDEGRELLRRAHDEMTAQEVRVPERFATMLLPGRWDVSAR